MQKWLYDISERIQALVNVLDEAEDKSIEPEVSKAIQGIYESDVPAAVADGIEYIKWQEEWVDTLDREIKRLQGLKKSRENRVKRVRAGYAEFLTAIGKKKIETLRGNMTVAAPSVSTKVDNIDDVPDAYKRTTVKIDADLTAIKQAIQGGHNVPGAHLEEKPSIRIK